MKKMLLLARVQLRALLTGFRVSGSRKRAASSWAALALMAGLCLYVSGLYSFALAKPLAQSGALDLLLLMMAGMAVAAGVMFTAFAAQGVVFSGRDADFLLSMPVPAFTVLLSKLTALYAENMMFCIFLVLPAGAAYLWQGGGGVLFVLRLLLATPLLGLLPTVLALAAGFLLSWLTGRSGNRKLVNLLLYALWMALIFMGMFQANQAVSALIAGAVSPAMNMEVPLWALPLSLYQKGVCGDWRALGLFCLITLAVLLAAAALLAGSYQRILTGLHTHRKGPDYRLTRLTASGRSRALLKKEAARYFGTPIYLFNTGIGLLLLLAAGIAAVVMRDRISGLLDQLGEQMPLLSLVAAAEAFLLSTVAITGSSISLEGRYLWILKEAPVSAREILRTKAGFQLLLAGPCLLVGVTGTAWGLGLTLPEGVLLLLLGLAFTAFTALLGLAVNLSFPKLDAVSDMAVVKQSAASMISTFGGMGAAAACGLLVWQTTGQLGEFYALALCGLALLLGCGGLFWWLRTRGERRFVELS